MTYTDNKIFIVELRSVKCVSVMEKKKKKEKIASWSWKFTTDAHGKAYWCTAHQNLDFILNYCSE